MTEGGKVGGVLKFLLSGGAAPGQPEAFAGVPNGDPHSPYSRFMWLSMAEDSGRRVGNRKEIAEAMRAYRVPGGGYSNVRGAYAATTNATSAAIMVIGQSEGYRESGDSSYLRELQHGSGGFGAAERVPVPDLLSTATALFALRQCGEGPKYPARDFIEAHWLENGGFAATLLDDDSDVEYTFYGLLALGAS
jgi:hypothetical protein